MADDATPAGDADAADEGAVQLERSTYEIIRNRLAGHGAELNRRLTKLNHARRDVFGSIETKLVATARITTDNNCVPSDMVAVGGRFLFGYNVHIGLKSETRLADVFAQHAFDENAFHAQSLELIADTQFEHDFRQLYKYYKNTTFTKFAVVGPHLFMVFQVGKSATDLKTFKWLIDGDRLKYLDNRSDHEFRFPPQHEFEWQRTHRDLHRDGLHPHISIEDRIFVETVGGDLTIKVEDNTDDGKGIYSEAVEDKDQVLDDAEIFYADLDNIILLKIRPYQETGFRYIAYNEKIQEARRLDSIAHSCVLLPEGHGLVFANGYYLQNGEQKTFDSSLQGMLFEKRIQSPNGEDFLFVFFNRESGIYVLLSYNVIEQNVETPILCHGYSHLDNGLLAFFKAHEDPQKHHPVQIWQTPYVGRDFVPHTETDSFLHKVGNRDIVRGMAECHEILRLIDREDTYANLYVDLAKKAGELIDSYFWLDHAEAFNLKEVLTEIRAAATAAVDEFDKVVRVRHNTKQRFDSVSGEVRSVLGAVRTKRFEQIGDFVTALADFRRLRGALISLKDLRYIDTVAVEQLEQQVAEQSENLANRCVDFLLKPDALAPYAQQVETQRAQIEQLAKVAEGRRLEEEIASSAGELEMLIDIVSNLKIDDATQRTQIIDNISAIYSKLNQARAALKKNIRGLLAVEGTAEFNAQIKLLGQGVVNYLDVCDTPEKCDEYLTKVMVQIEELEGRFAEFDEFVVQLSEKREEIYTAFDSRKLALVESRNKRAAALMSAAERILKGIETRTGNLKTVDEIHSYFASDLMIEKVRDIVGQLDDLDDAVKVGDIQSRLKTIREDAVRQLKDRRDLYVEGENIIRLGKHLFSVNVQHLDLTTVLKDGEMCYHLTGTNFLEPITDEDFLGTRDLWDQEVVSENAEVYRAEYLAYQYLESQSQDPSRPIEDLLSRGDEALIADLQRFMGSRYSEGYVKGVHDHDAARFVRALAEMGSTLGLLRYAPGARALAALFWQQLDEEEKKNRLRAKLKGVGTVAQLFSDVNGRVGYVRELQELIGGYVRQSSLFHEALVDQAGEYLFEEIAHGDRFSVSGVAAGIRDDFQSHLEGHKFADRFTTSIEELGGHPESTFRLLRTWVESFLAERDRPDEAAFADEVAVTLLNGESDSGEVLEGSTTKEITGLVGDHPILQDGTCRVDYNEFTSRLEHFHENVVPRYRDYVERKKALVDGKRESLRLDEFRPRVLTSFVRNKLIDQVYLPIIGDNLAKQIGVAGEQKRTDLMGLLLLVSPPGYGKTTLMEYLANRLGITFMKINCPAIGHRVTSLDPAEAPNASAREEVEKLNLALEMGDNIMLYLDDIQHSSPEFLQKFISLCDAQRKIEGVYQGVARTYDLRGRKVAVVMAGNPYTESGEKFKVPDMLANRADTYNLGDFLGEHAKAFTLSYLENALTSNPVLAHLASRSQNDVYAVVKMAENDSPEGIDLEGNYSVDELNDLVAVMRKLMRLRDVVLTVNQQYIRSAAQADDYRTEPPFKLQGSYRDMNKMAERVAAIMNDEELESLIMSHYENQAQTLTTGAEANLLKFKELLGRLTKEEGERWESIKRTFQRNVMLRGAGSDDKFGQVVAQLSTFSDGLTGIKEALGHATSQLANTASPNGVSAEHVQQVVEHLGAFSGTLIAIKEALVNGALNSSPRDVEADETSESQEQTIRVVNKVPRAFLDVIQTQFNLMQTWVKSILELAESGATDAKTLKKSIDETFGRYEILLEKLEDAAARLPK